MVTRDSTSDASDAKSAGRGARRRISRWDRPPEPHDWRFYTGSLGRILIAIGLLMFGFVAYQLWGTGIETARAQASLESEFEARLAGTSDQATQPADTTANTESSLPPTSSTPSATEPSTSLVAADPAITEIVPADEQNLPEVSEDEALLRIEIPTIGVDSLVVGGVTREDLKKGPGHFPDTPLPGQLGNAAIAGHRTTYGAPFNELDELDVGDRIEITRLDGNQYTFSVTGREIVNPDDYWVVTTTDPDRVMLTLTTCHPETTARQRMAVFAELIVDESGPVGEATIRDPDAATTDEALPGETTDGSSTDGTTASDEPSEHIVDAFAGGWFDDAAAWPQIAIWGVALIAIWFAIYLLARRFRSYPIGILIGVVPFLVTLYFLYQNVNRLLPAGL